MKTLFVLILGLALGAFGYYIYKQSGSDRTTPGPEEITQGGSRTNESSTERKGDLRAEQIRDELARSGRVVRKKAQEVGAAVSDATADARITGSIKTKLAVDSDLSALTVSVNTTEGVVTLSGTVSSHEHIAKAIKLALETEGVSEVVSTLQVKQSDDR
jgi:osmotically-inducible protein OsmY